MPLNMIVVLSLVWNFGSALASSEPKILVSGKIPFQRIPGEIVSFADPKGEAMKYFSPFPNYPDYTGDSGLSALIFPYIHREERYKLFKAHYNKFNLSHVSPSKEFMIPPIIHQIWLGPKSRDKFERMRQTWLRNHPGWLYKLWTEEDLKKLTLINQEYFDRARCYGEKSDILRYELLYLFGGLYVDLDTESVRPIDILLHSYKFFVSLSDVEGIVGNPIIGSVAGHPILRETILAIPDRINNLKIGGAGATGGCGLTSQMIKMLPAYQDGSVIALPYSYLEGRMESDWSRPKKPRFNTFVAHAEANSWNDPSF